MPIPLLNLGGMASTEDLSQAKFRDPVISAPMTFSWIFINLEKQGVPLAKRLVDVRSVR